MPRTKKPAKPPEPPPCCGTVVLVTGAVVYPLLPGLADKKFWRCESCGGYVGCHGKGHRALGTPGIEIIGHDGSAIAKLTVSIAGVGLADNECLVKTWSENEATAKAVLATGLFVDTGRRTKAGYCEAQVWRLAKGRF